MERLGLAIHQRTALDHDATRRRYEVISGDGLGFPYLVSGENIFVNWTRLLSVFHKNVFMAPRANRIAALICEFPIGECSVLDVGSGNGNLAFNIMKIRPDIHIQGVDVLLWPLQKIPTTEFDGKTIPANDCEWDYCLVSDVLHHCDEPSQLLAELNRVSRMGVIVKDHIADSRLDHAILSFMDWFGNRGHGVRLTYKYWSWKRWSAEFANNGLVPVRIVDKLNLYPRPLAWIFDRNLHFLTLLEKGQLEADSSISRHESGVG